MKKSKKSLMEGFQAVDFLALMNHCQGEINGYMGIFITFGKSCHKWQGRHKVKGNQHCF